MRKIIILLTLVLLWSNTRAQENTSYYFSKTVDGSFEEVTVKVKEALKENGFGIVTEIDMDKVLAEKLDTVNLLPYKILGACNPGYAYQTLQIEENIGLFLPCKVLVKATPEKNKIEVVMVNPSELMRMLENEELEKIAEEVSDKFKAALESI